MTILGCYDIQAGIGGVETISLRIDRELAGRHHRYVCVLPGASVKSRVWEDQLSSVYVGPLHTLSWKQSPANFMRLVRFYQRILRHEAPDVILVHWAPLVLLPRWLQCVHSLGQFVPIIVYEHGALGEMSTHSVSPWYRWVYRQSLVAADHIVCGGGDYAQAVLQITQIQVTVHAHGLPINWPCPLIPRSATFHLVFVGRFNNRPKRIDRLLKACALIPRDWAWTVQLVGDGPDRALLQQPAVTLGIASRCIWSGWQNDPWSVIEHATVMAFPSDYEGFGVIMVEAMAHGIPVLATDCNFGPRSIIQTVVIGWLVSRTDSAFATHLVGLVAGDIPIPAPGVVMQSVADFSTNHVVDRLLTDVKQLGGARLQ